MKKRNVLITIFGLWVFCATQSAFPATHWPQFRGPGGSGVADGQKPPIHFGPGSNELWKVSVPAGASSPCVWGNSIFLTAFSDGKLETICVASVPGVLSVLDAGEKPEVVGRADFKERLVATPAIVDNKLYVRAASHLWAFGK